MGITRLYTGLDGQSHLEERGLASHPELTAFLATKGIVFRSTQPGHFSQSSTMPSVTLSTPMAAICSWY